MSPRRVISFAKSAVALEWSGERAQAIVDFLFPPVYSVDDIAPHVTFRLEPCRHLPPHPIIESRTTGGLSSNEPEPATDGLALFRDETRVLATDDDGQIAEFLLGEVSFHLADKSYGGIVLHAGALAYKGYGILAAGVIGAGKTTLTAWLVARGCEYLTDEMVWIPEGSDRLETLPRPLSIKTPSRAVLEPFLNMARPGALYHCPSGDLVSPAALGSTRPATSPRLRAILFPRYDPSAQPEISPLSKAQTGLALMECLLNARNLTGQGFDEVARLARDVPGYRLRYRAFAEIEGDMAGIIASIKQP